MNTQRPGEYILSSMNKTHRFAPLARKHTDPTGIDRGEGRGEGSKQASLSTLFDVKWDCLIVSLCPV